MPDTKVTMILPNGFICVGLYESSRCYGGPEEGGWWYNQNDHVESFVIPEDTLEEFRKAHKEGKTLESYPMGSNYIPQRDPMADEQPEMVGEAFGDTSLVVSVEDYPGSCRTTERPHYE